MNEVNQLKNILVYLYTDLPPFTYITRVCRFLRAQGSHGQLHDPGEGMAEAQVLTSHAGRAE
jgi:hypothetical protein